MLRSFASAGLRARALLSQSRFASSGNKKGAPAAFDPFAGSPLAAPELPPASGSELWTNAQTKPAPLSAKDTQDPDALFHHPLYTPPARPYTGIGPLLGPMQWPEFDQSGLLASKVIASPPGADPKLAQFEDPLDAPIGAYPRITHQFTELKDPYKYWDQQGRRNYGDILQDQELQMNHLSHGPGHAPGPYVATIGGVLAAFALLFGVIHSWDPSNHLWQAERDYPFNGLHVELGADPENLDDTAVTARQYKNQFDPTYKPI